MKACEPSPSIRTPHPSIHPSHPTTSHHIPIPPCTTNHTDISYRASGRGLEFYYRVGGKRTTASPVLCQATRNKPLCIWFAIWKSPVSMEEVNPPSEPCKPSEVNWRALRAAGTIIISGGQLPFHIYLAMRVRCHYRRGPGSFLSATITCGSPVPKLYVLLLLFNKAIADWPQPQGRLANSSQS